MNKFCKVEIFNIKEEYAHKFMFMPYRYLEKEGFEVSLDTYYKAYECTREYNYSLDAIYEEFNIRHPKDYCTHSLSMGDVVVITQEGTTDTYYVDMIGFTRIPNFFKETAVA